MSDVGRRRFLVALALAALPCRSAGAQAIEPIVVDGDRVFRLGWELSERRGRPVLLGRIDNLSDFGTSQIQLLVERLDASGKVTSQKLAWVGVNVRPGDHAFFEVPVTDRAGSYRVRVYSFTRKFGSGN